MIKFIGETLKELSVPCSGIYISETVDLNPSKIWTKEKIIKEIKSEASELIQ